MKKISLDFETYSECDIKSAGAWAYAKDPSTRVLCMAYAEDEQAPNIWIPGKNRIPDFLADPKNYEIHAWNSFFEWVIWTHVLKQPTPPLTQWHDTASLASAMALPRALGSCGYVLGMPESQLKSKRGYYLISKLSKPNKLNGDPSLLKEMYEYCIQDVITERAIAKKLYKLNATERKVWELDQRINIRGVHVDKPNVEKAIDIYEKAQDDLIEKLRRVTSLENPNSQKQFLGWLLNQGLLVDNIQKATLKEILGEPDKYNVHEAIRLKLSLAKTAPKKYISIRDRVAKGNTLHGNIMYHGASTGRWASTGVNLQNIARPTIDPDKCIALIEKNDIQGFKESKLDVMEALSSSIRGMLIPKDGCKFVVGDYASIEARALAWLAGQEDKLDIFRTHGKIYEHSASKIFRKPIDEITKDERFLGKIAELACGYGGGAGAFNLMAKNYGVDIPKTQAEKMKKEWRNTNKKITLFWQGIEQSAKQALEINQTTSFRNIKFRLKNRFLWCHLPSGRNLAYFQPFLEPKTVLGYKLQPDLNSPEQTVIYNPVEYECTRDFTDEARRLGAEPFSFQTSNICFFGNDSKTRKWSKQTTYGGKLVENITQAVARDIMAESMLSLEKKKYKIVLTVHDEIISETEHGNVEEFKTIMAKPPKWAKTMPIEVEAYESKRYRK
tara:strand:- start:511 stop:2520 length:2010 start_codon:yes stop_codon:yes gene_type:complete